MSVQWMPPQVWDDWKQREMDSTFLNNENGGSYDAEPEVLEKAPVSETDVPMEIDLNSSVETLDDTISGQSKADSDQNASSESGGKEDNAVVPDGSENSRSNSRNKKKELSKKPVLDSTLGTYWQLPQTNSPCNRPKRANAGANMVTKLTANRRKSESPAKKQETPPTTPKPKPKPARQSTKQPKVLMWHEKSVNSTIHELSEKETIISRQMAVKSLAGIPESICTSSHVSFVQSHKDWFDHSDVKSLRDFMVKAKPQVESTAKKFGLESYLKKLARKRKEFEERLIEEESVPVPEAASSPIKTSVEEAPAEVMTATDETVEGEPAAMPVPAISQPLKEVNKPKPSAKRKYEEDERAEIVKLENNQIMVDGQIYNVNYEDYLKETDVDIPYDDHVFAFVPKVEEGQKDSGPKAEEPETPVKDEAAAAVPLENIDMEIAMPVLQEINPVKDDGATEASPRDRSLSPEVNGPEEVCIPTIDKFEAQTENIEKNKPKSENPTEEVKHSVETEPASVNAMSCALSHCRLGCICHSVKAVRLDPKDHCGKLNCMFECACNVSAWGDDVSIRSRLRPRVSLLNWNYRLNYMDAFTNDKEKDTLAKRPDSQGRIRRHIIPPKRNNDFVSHAHAQASSKKPKSSTSSAQDQAKLSLKKIRNRIAQKRQPFVATIKAKHKLLMMSDKKSSSKGDVSKIERLPKKDGARLSNGVLKGTATYSHKTNIRNVNEGTGPIIPAELLAKFAPFLELQYRPPPSKYLPESDSSDSDSEDDDSDVGESNYPSVTISSSPRRTESDEFLPVIVSYASCNGSEESAPAQELENCSPSLPVIDTLS